MLLNKISDLQVTQDPFYDEGLFPSQITGRNGRKSVEDNNIFFTASTIYTLESIKNTLTKNDQNVIENISLKAKKTFQFYKNRKGGLTYNFYQVNPENPLPGFRFLSKFEFAKLPDDLDDTSIIWLVQPSSDNVNQLLKQKMSGQSYKESVIDSTFKEYRSSKAYRSWFAVKMKQDLDIVVNCNVLTFVFEKGLTLDSVDHEAIDFIKSVVSTNKHINQGYLVSAYYQKTSVILYHIARLISVANYHELNEIREKVICDLHSELKSTTNTMEKIVLLSSLYRLNEKVEYQIDLSNLISDMHKFYWFKTNFLCGYKFWIKKLFGESHFLNYHHKSEAYYWSLVLELKQISTATIATNNNQNTTLYKKLSTNFLD